jgi:hypothetical protein
MRAGWWLGLAAFAVACGGDKETGVDDTLGDDDDDDEPLLIDCTELPTYDLDSLDCGQLGNAFQTTMNDATLCNSDQDCRVVRAGCEHWNDVICWYAANYCTDPGGAEPPWDNIVSAFNSAAASCGGDDVCDCGSAPPVTCVDQRCQLGDTTTSR